MLGKGVLKRESSHKKDPNFSKFLLGMEWNLTLVLQVLYLIIFIGLLKKLFINVNMGFNLADDLDQSSS